MKHLLWTSEYFTYLSSKIESYDYAQRAFKALKKKVQNKIESPIEIPLSGGGWSHRYNCPEDGTRLECLDRNHHKCSTCGKIWSGSPWDDTAIANEHWNYSINCRDAAVLYGITKDKKWSDWAKKVILFYAEHYKDYPFHDKNWEETKSGGKVQCQTLSEASWIAPLAQGFHILRINGVLSQEEQSFIDHNLFKPAVDVIDGNPMGKSNWQTYHNAAKASIAAATDDRDLLEEVIVDKNNGFMFQMENSLGDDGFWYEGAWGYHFYTLDAQIMIVMAALAFDIHLYKNERFQSMFKAPLNCQLPDHTLPPVHDSGEENITNRYHLYEFSSAFFGVGGELVKETERNSLYSLLFGKEFVEKEIEKKKQFFTYTDLKKAGMVFARAIGSDKGKEQVIMVDYGDHGGGHGHYDKLNFIYYSGNHPWITDAGMLQYANPMHQGWFRQTVAHNTIVVDGVSQREASGRLIDIKKLEDRLELTAEVDDAYAGVCLRRRMVLTDEFLVDIYDFRCDKDKDVDFLFHTQGYPVHNKEGLLHFSDVEQGFKLGESNGYEYLKELKKASNYTKQWMMEWKWNEEENSKQLFQIYGFIESIVPEIYLAESIAMPPIKRRSTFIQRMKQVKQGRFITVYRTCDKEDNPLKFLYTKEQKGIRNLQIQLDNNKYYNIGV